MTDSNEDFFERVGTDVGLHHSGAAPKGSRVNSLSAAEDSIEPKQRTASNARRWAQADDLFWQASDSRDTLEPAFYRFENMPFGPALRKTTITTDGLIHLPDTIGEKVLNEFKVFWSLREEFTKRSFLHKRGMLLHGPAGGGKTSSLMLMAQQIVEVQKGIVCQIDHPGIAAVCLNMIRKIEPDRPIIAFMEDLDTLIQYYGESEFLSLLDGETQVDRICYVATTNYPERLDRRFVDRPSRFDTVEFIGMPSKDARRVYLHAKETSLSSDELDDWVGRTEGFSVAHLRELIILVKCFQRPLKDAVQRLEKMRFKPSSEHSPDRAKVGFEAVNKGAIL